MRNTIIITIILFVAVIVASIFYFRDINKDQHNSIKPLKYLPENTFLITSIKNDEVTDNIFKDFDLFEAIIGRDDFKILTKYKNQILRQESLAEYIADEDIYISLHPNKEKLDMLFTIPTTEQIKEANYNTVIQEIGKNYKIKSIDTLGQRITSLSFGTPDTTLFTTYYNSVIFASFNQEILLKVIDKSVPKLSEKQIDYFIHSNSRNTPLSVFLTHQQLPEIIKHFQQREKGIFADQFIGLDGQSAWNINFKQDALMLTGESKIEKSTSNYISIFRNQTKKTQRLYNYFPSNTAVFMEYSVDNYNRFSADLHEYFIAKKDTNRIKSALETLSDTTSSSNKLTQIVDHNFALIELTNQTHLGFISLKDTVAWKKIANNILEDSDDETYRFKNSNILYALYGEPYKNMSRPYVARVEDVLVFANSKSDLKEYLQDNQAKDLLTGTLGFKNFEKLQGNDASVTLFIHNKNAFSKILYSLPNHYQKNFRDKDKFGFQDFYSWSIQLSGNNGNFSSQIYAIYKSKNALGNNPEWSYQLDEKAITRPYVFEQSDTSQFILIQELDHTVHAIHPSGKKLWSTLFSGRIVGDIKQLQDRSLLLVTDKNRLYRFDSNGKTLKGFSATIPDEPVAAPTLSTFNNKEVILVPTLNKVYAFDLEGKIIEDWKIRTFEGRLLGEIQIIGQNYAVGSTYGRIYVLNNDGSLKNEIDIPGDVEFDSPIGVMSTANNQFEILSFDNKSNFHKSTLEKIFSSTKIDLEEGKSYSHYINLTGNSNPELVLIHNNKLLAFDVNEPNKPLFEYFFTKNIEDKPQFFKHNTSSEHLIGVASKATNLLYLFTETGSLVEGFPLEGQPLFYYGKINYNSDTYLLCVRRDRKLHAFKHQK